jgi:hypothetical protein
LGQIGLAAQPLDALPECLTELNFSHGKTLFFLRYTGP